MWMSMSILQSWRCASGNPEPSTKQLLKLSRSCFAAWGNPSGSPLPSGSAETAEVGQFPKEDFESRVSEVLRRYSLASGSRKLMYGTGSGVSQEIQNTFPAERNGEREEKSSISDLFPLTPPSRQNLFHPVFSDLVYLGALWDTYLIFPASEGMLLIDQHAAHERVLFEKIKGGAGEKKNNRSNSSSS